MGNEDMTEQLDRELITDEEIAADPTLFKDEDGVHRIFNGGTALIQPSKEYKAKYESAVPTEREPTFEEYLLELDFRLSSAEIGGM